MNLIDEFDAVASENENEYRQYGTDVFIKEMEIYYNTQDGNPALIDAFTISQFPVQGKTGFVDQIKNIYSLLVLKLQYLCFSLVK